MAATAIGSRNVYWCSHCKAHQIVVGKGQSIASFQKEQQSLLDAQISTVWNNNLVDFDFGSRRYSPLKTESSCLTFYTDKTVKIEPLKLYSHTHESCIPRIAPSIRVQTC